MNSKTKLCLWSVAFLGTLLTPLALAAGSGHRGRFALEISLVLGLVATSLLACVVVMVSRPRSLTTTIGIEQILRVHRYLGVTMVGAALAHTLVVLLANPRNLALLDLVHAPPRARAATVAMLALVLLAGLSLLRRRLRLPYRVWRVTHVLLAATVVVATTLHVVLLHHLVSETTMRACFGVLVAVVVLGLVNRWLLRPLGLGQRTFRVWDVWVEAGDVITLVLAPEGAHRLSWIRPLRLSPGQFAWIRYRRWGLCSDHPFTIASAARDDGMIEFTIRRIGDYTHALARLRPGTRVYLDGPHGSFTSDRATTAAGLVLIAGGVGITPMMSMLRASAERGDPRPPLLVAGVRRPRDLLFADEIERLRGRLDLTVVATATQPDASWTGSVGRVDAALLESAVPYPPGRDRIDYFVCGSAPFVEGVLGALHAIRVPPERIRTEQFEMV